MYGYYKKKLHVNHFWQLRGQGKENIGNDLHLENLLIVKQIIFLTIGNVKSQYKECSYVWKWLKTSFLFSHLCFTVEAVVPSKTFFFPSVESCTSFLRYFCQILQETSHGNCRWWKGGTMSKVNFFKIYSSWVVIFFNNFKSGKYCWVAETNDFLECGQLFMRLSHAKLVHVIRH